MTKYRYFYVIQQSVSPTIWKDFYKLAEGIGKADAVSQLMAFESRDKETKYRIIRRRFLNNEKENYNIFREDRPF